MKTRTADRPNSRKSTQSRLATTVATTAVSLVILTAAQEQLDAKDPKGLTIRQNQPQNGQSAAIEKYFAQGYNYCDALVLAAFWGEKSALDAKYRLGQKMLDFGPEDGLIHIRNARGEALKKDPSDMPCWFTDGGYTFDDAELLGQYWGTGIGESKATMTSLLVGGHENVIQKALRSAKRGQ
ncbi:MAG: hypothetical protein H7A54_00390 [Akkermansiaceae bacterium]|nr:hypothetical protein [Verrucomicrobiae bacterium]MCP5552086.1 hypothetical protein [Akkermansiaceae bacterium]